MHPHRLTFLATLLSLTLTLPAKDGGNSPYVTTMDQQSRFYARCLPTDRAGSQGTTQILRVRPEGDELLTTFNWYNRRGLVLGWSPTAGKIAVLRVQQDAGLPIDKQIELSIYLGQDLVRSYTTTDLQKRGAIVERDALAAEAGIQGPDGKSPTRAQYHVEGCFQVWNTNDYYFKIELPQAGILSPSNSKPAPKTLLLDIVTGKPCQVTRHPTENKEEMKLLE